MSKPSYPAFTPTGKTGKEAFVASGEAMGFDLLSFWQWSCSDLISNATRGVLAEYLVAKALDLPMGTRTEWDAYDLRMTNGTTLEVKSAAYLQSWHQEKLSSISFSIAPSRAWDPNTGTFHEELKRQADVYVFGLLETKDQGKLDPMDLDQWIFYVLDTQRLNEHSLEQKTISLNALLKLNPIECTFDKLQQAVANLKPDCD